MVQVGEVLIEEGASSIFSYITPKIVAQMGRRGWNKELIHSIVNSPFTVRSAINRATSSAATAFFTKEGFDVVKGNITNEIIQISNKLDQGWIPDATIVNPYRPRRFMNKVEQLFLSKALNRAGIFLYSKRDALEFIEECRKQGVPVLGVDGFYLTDSATQPSMDNSIDFSMRPLGEEIFDEAVRFLTQRGDHLHFEIVCAERIR